MDVRILLQQFKACTPRSKNDKAILLWVLLEAEECSYRSNRYITHFGVKKKKKKKNVRQYVNLINVKGMIFISAGYRMTISLSWDLVACCLQYKDRDVFISHLSKTNKQQ